MCLHLEMEVAHSLAAVAWQEEGGLAPVLTTLARLVARARPHLRPEPSLLLLLPLLAEPGVLSPLPGGCLTAVQDTVSIRVYHTRHFSFKSLGSTVYSILGTHSMSPFKRF